MNNRLFLLYTAILGLLFPGFSLAQIVPQLNMSTSIISSQDRSLSADGQLIASFTDTNNFKAQLTLAAKDTKSVALDEALFRWKQENHAISLGFDSPLSGVQGHVSDDAKKWIRTVESDRALKESGYSPKQFQLAGSLDYQKKVQPFSANIAILYDKDRILPSVSASLGWHWGKRDRVLGLSGQALPLWLNYPSLGNRLDVHGVVGFFIADTEEDILWSFQGEMGTLPSEFPWSTETKKALTTQWFGAFDSSLGVRLLMGDNVLVPSARFSGALESLLLAPVPTLQADAGAKFVLFKSISLWFFGGAQYVPTVGTVSPLWDLGLKMEQ